MTRLDPYHVAGCIEIACVLVILACVAALVYTRGLEPKQPVEYNSNNEKGEQ